MRSYYYAPEESFVNGLRNGISGAVEGFVLSAVLAAFKIVFVQLQSGDMFDLIILGLAVPTIYSLLRIFIAFTYMTRFSTIVYYITFITAYAIFSMYLGDYLSAFLVLFAVFVAIVIRIKMESPQEYY